MYELHILVHPSQEALLNASIYTIASKFPQIYSCKAMATLTSTGINPRQPMISGFVDVIKIHDVIDLGNEVSRFLTSLTFNVTRIKIEQLINLDTVDPLTRVSGDDYFEAHIKIGQSIPCADSYANLAHVCLKHGVQLLLNPYSIKMAPVTTMRLYDADIRQFTENHRKLVTDLEIHGFMRNKQHIELGVYDSNPFTDEGWLFKQKDYKTPIKSCDCPERLQIPLFEKLIM